MHKKVILRYNDIIFLLTNKFTFKLSISQSSNHW